MIHFMSIVVCFLYSWSMDPNAAVNCTWLDIGPIQQVNSSHKTERWTVSVYVVVSEGGEWVLECCVLW